MYTFSLMGQAVDCVRTAILSNGAYEMEGTAYLERSDDESFSLRLGSDFLTQSGPDVQIFLSNDSTSTAGGIMLADIGTTDGLSHFSGEISFIINDKISISQYNFVVFRCVTFDAFWGGGRLGIPSCEDPVIGGGGGMDTTTQNLCTETIVATTDWASEITICTSDGEDDIIELINSGGISAGDRYAYIFADANNNIRFLHFEDSFNFEGSSQESEYIFGVSYRGTLSYNIGDPINSILSDSCAIISSLTTFLTVKKENCSTDFECQESITATTNWATEVHICPSDGIADVIPLINNQFVEPGEHYSYLITDTLNRLIAVHNTSSFDFENSGSDPNRVFGISFAGTLNYTLGDPIANITADSCFILSGDALFLTVYKDSCETSSSTFSISGKIASRNGGDIQGAEVRLNNGMKTVTDASGNYTISGLAGNVSYNVKAYYNDGPANGISSTDLVLTARHILSFITFTDPYQLMAADVNNNGSISASDLVQMKRVLLGLSSTFSNNLSWRFIDASQDLTTVGVIPDEMITVQLDKDVSDINFIGVKIGDVNDNARLDLRE